VPRESRHQGLQNEPPLDMSELPLPDSQPCSRGWLLMGLGVAAPTYQVGAHFEALDEGFRVAPLKSSEHFFFVFQVSQDH